VREITKDALLESNCENYLASFQIGKKNRSAVQISCGLFIKGDFFMAM